MANKWSFDNNKGKDLNSSEKWGVNYKNCMIENTQSPINIVSGGNKKCGPLTCPIKFQYLPSRCTLKKDKNLLYLIDKGNNHINYKLNTFTLEKTTFHMPSMHTLDGAYYDMELMLHHIANDGEKVIVSVFVSQDNDISLSQNWFRQFIPFIPKKYKKSDTFPKMIIKTKSSWNINNLLPIGRSFYMYLGSLPYPPCDRSTIFIVLNNAVNINTEDYNVLKKLINNSNRPIQKIGNRTVYFNDKLNNDIKRDKIYIKCAKIEKSVSKEDSDTKEGMTSSNSEESNKTETKNNVVLTSKINYWNIFTLLIGVVLICLSAYGGMELVRWLIRNKYISFCNDINNNCSIENGCNMPITSDIEMDKGGSKGGGKILSNLLNIMKTGSKKDYKQTLHKDIASINNMITKYRGNINL
jgi:carbonic anhydrase